MTKNISTLVFFFMRGTSLALWEKIGIFDREVAVYNALAKSFNKIYLMTYGDEKEKQYEKYLRHNIEIVPNKWRINAAIYSFMAPFLNAKKLREANFYRTDQMDGAWTAAVAKLLFRKKLIVRTGYTWSKFIEENNIFTKFIVWLIEMFTYKLCDFALVTSDDDRRYLLEKFPFLQGKIATIPNYIDTERFKPRAMRKYADRIIFVGRLAAQKNVLNLIKALQGLSWGLDIVGEGSEKREIEMAAKKNHVNTRFLGIVRSNHLPSALNKYRIFVLPSFYEGMPKSLLEAMSCGLACIGTRVAGTKEVITDSVNGLLTSTDELSLKKTIQRLINNNVLQKKLGIAARQLILDKYSLNNNLFKEIKIYDSFKK